MKPSDLGALTQPGEVAVAPDGATVAFTVVTIDLDANQYRSRIWIGPSDGSTTPRPFTAGEHRDVMPRWSPDGTRLAFVSHRESHDSDAGTAAAAGSQILVIPVGTGGEVLCVARWVEEINELAWSPDGTRLAFVAPHRDEARYGPPDQPARKERDMPPRRIRRFLFRIDSHGWEVDRPRHLFVVPADGSSKPRLLTPGEHQVGGLAWSPDSSRLAFVSARHDTWDLDLADDIWTVPSDRADGADGDAELTRVTDTDANYLRPSWSPDGTRLAYLRTQTPLSSPRHGQVGVVDLTSGQRLELTNALDRNCAPYPDAHAPVWDGDSLLFSVEDSGNVQLYRVPANGTGKPQLVVGGDRAVTSWDFKAAGTIAYVASTPVTLGEVFVTGEGTTERQLTDFTGPFAARVELSPPERFVATAPDGTEVECWAIPPNGHNNQPHPTLLNIHGGPFTQYGNRFFDEFQFQAGAGFGVIYCNPRGSSGYSEAWGRAIRWPEADDDPGSGWGGVDYDDVMACVDEACRRFPWIDSERLGIMGGSYGGYMTSWAIGHTDRFKAACSERACNDLLSLEYNSDIASLFRTEVGKSHLEAPDAYLRQSPIRYVQDMTTPVLIVHSENDLRCPISQADELFVALRLLGREPEMVRFPAESHELSRSGAPKHRVMRAELILEWFRERLL
jgi:dipeptidyl aminopeptidase/acylaminoacyl peptidase